jgi:hypothetical protein
LETILFKNNNNKAPLFFMLLMPLVSYAEVYQWVDENGTMHYAATKPANAESTVVKFHSQPKSLKTPAELLQEKERQRRLAIDRETALKKVATKPETRPPRSLSGGVEDGSDASRCNLARDILNGALRHSNGKPVDVYDIKTANNDVRKFCH